MGNWKSIVITAYGHDKFIDKITVNLFDESETWFPPNAEAYCDNINSLEPQGEAWVSARVVSKDTQYTLDEFLPFKFDFLLKLDDRTIQTILREVDNKDIALALKGTNEVIQEKIFSNMSKNATQMIKEAIVYMGPIRFKDREEAQKRILKIICFLEDFGEIITPHSKGGTIE